MAFSIRDRRIVIVDKNVVTLTGHVNSYAEKLAAMGVLY
jgi:osmotically-inducible protein OsmY